MKIPNRIIIPASLAVGVTGLIGVLFLWQIRESVALIESGFKGLRDKTAEMLNIPAAKPSTPDARSRSQALMYMRQGEIFELKGQWAKAQEQYRQSVDSGGGTPALRKLAAIQLQRRQYDDVADTIRRLKKEDGDTDSILLIEGLLQLRIGSVAEARRTFGRTPDSPQGQYGLAIASILERDHDAAKAGLMKAAQNTDPTIRSYANTILAAYNEFALFERGQDIHLATLVARALAQVNECETALSLVTDVVALQDRYRDAWIVKGYCEFVTERLPDALSSLQRAYSIDPEKPEIQYFLARTYAAQGDTQNAVTYLQYAIVNGFRPQTDARELLAEYALELGNTQLALEQYKALWQTEGSEFPAFEKYIELALRLPDLSMEAYQAAKTAAVRWPDDAKVLTLLGRAAAATGDRVTAIENFNNALKIDPTYGRAQEELQKLQGEAPAGVTQ